MGQVMAAKVVDREFPENVIDDGGAHLDRFVAHHHSIGLKTGEDEGLDKFFKGDTMLEAEGNCDGKTVHQTAERRAFLVHVHKNFTQCTVFIFSGPQVQFMTADQGFLGVAVSAEGHTPALGDVAVDDLFCDLDGGRMSKTFLKFVFLLIPNIRTGTRVQRLTQF